MLRFGSARKKKKEDLEQKRREEADQLQLTQRAAKIAKRLRDGVPPSMVIQLECGLEDVFELRPRPLGQGQMCTVFRVSRRSDDVGFALKVLNLSALEQSERAMQKVLAEIAALRLIPPHARIVRLLAIACAPTECALAVDSSDDDLLTLLESCGGQLSESEARPLLAQVISAVAHLHAHRWAHRDIKPEHVALSTAVGGGDGAPSVESRAAVRRAGRTSGEGSAGRRAGAGAIRRWRRGRPMRARSGRNLDG